MLKLFHSFRANRWVPSLFFLLLLILAIVIHKDYGLSWDDPVQRQLGLETWDYIFGKNDALFSNDNCYINPFVAALEVLPEKILQPHSERAAYTSGHLFNFIFCWAGMIFFYLLALRIFKDFRFALLTVLLLVLTPRLFAHCFYNSKDLPFLFLFVVNAYLLTSWVQQPAWSKTMWMVIFSGILTATRVVGVLFPIIVLIVAAIGVVARKLKRSEMKMIMGYLLLYPVSVYVFFPSIWHDPVTKFFNALVLYSHHPYDVTTFFMGETVHSLNTPWYYVPVWMAITIPLGWWFSFLAGIIFLCRNFIRERIQFSLSWLIIILWFLIPLAAVIILHSSTYDDGRHLFFIYPPFLLIAVKGIRSLLNVRTLKEKLFQWIAAAGTAIVFLITAAYVITFMIRFHPYQYAYFNAIGRKYAADYFEKDYWGLSYRQGLEYLVQHAKEDTIKACWQNAPCNYNLIWLNEEQRKKIKEVPFDSCEYFLTDFRYNPEQYTDSAWYTIRVNNVSILAIEKLR